MCYSVPGRWPYASLSDSAPVNEMTAIEISSFGPPDVLKPVDRPSPFRRNNEVLILVEAAGVSRADMMQRQGKYPPPPGASDIPGLDVAGIVDSVGANVRDWKLGDRVCAILNGGGYAEFCAAPALAGPAYPEAWTPRKPPLCPKILYRFDNLITRAALRAVNRLIHRGDKWHR